jgi:hypothetical protein
LRDIWLIPTTNTAPITAAIARTRAKRELEPEELIALTVEVEEEEEVVDAVVAVVAVVAVLLEVEEEEEEEVEEEVVAAA